jgi:hypothetical protein
MPAKNQVIATPSLGTDLTHGGNNLMQTMGAVDESNCQGNTMTWDKSKTPWEKLQLAQNLNLYQNIWQGTPRLRSLFSSA